MKIVNKIYSLTILGYRIYTGQCEGLIYVNVL